MAGGELHGWYRDPFGMHEERYFSAGRPTKLVRDGGVDSYDEPPSQTYDIAAVAPSPAPMRDNLFLPDSPPRPPARGYGLDWAITAVVVITVGAFVAFVTLSGGSKPASKPAISPAAFVAASTRHTLAMRTVQISLSMTFGLNGESVPITGTGAIDFGANAVTLNVSTSASGQSVLEKEILVRGNIYLSMTINGQGFASVTRGRHWLQMAMPRSATSGLTTGYPFTSLAELEHNGMNVRELGTETVGSRACTGYTVSAEQAGVAPATLAAVRKVVVPSPEGSSSAAPGVTQPAITVWFDQQGLLCQISGGDQANAPAGSDNLVLTFSDWGAPVHITAPPPSDTISAKDFLRKVTGSNSLFCGLESC